MPAKGEKYFFISSLAKGLKIMEMLSEHKALTVSEVAKQMDSNRAASHRFLATLRELGYVEKNDDNRYQLTFRIMEMGMMVADRFEIRQEARKFMQDLVNTFNETVNLGFWDGNEILYLDKIDSSEVLRIDARLWSKTPAYCTALGKAVLAHLTKEEINDYLKHTRLVPHGPNTIVSKKRFREELAAILERGYSVDNEELVNGLRCVAAPVFDHTGQPRYALSISCPTFRLSMDDVESVHPKVRDICSQLSLHIGYRPDGAGNMSYKMPKERINK
ncbi:MAG: IclR family transcriptional regulator [Deltaproteobacteria bacterium]|nr:IclR family transcriptional regulator [Deltaproteobacteria bacterium]